MFDVFIMNPNFVFICLHLHRNSCWTGEVFAVACSPTDATLVATGGEDEKGFLWKIGKGDWAFELKGMSMTKQLQAALLCSLLFVSK